MGGAGRGGAQQGRVAPVDCCGSKERGSVLPGQAIETRPAWAAKKRVTACLSCAAGPPLPHSAAPHPDLPPCGLHPLI